MVSTRRKAHHNSIFRHALKDIKRAKVDVNAFAKEPQKKAFIDSSLRLRVVAF